MIFADFHLSPHFFLSPSFSLHSLKNHLAYFSAFTLSLVTCVTCARTRLTYIHEETSIIVDSKSRLKHRNAVACLYKIPKNTIPYHELCCWMTIVTVRWLFVGSLAFRSVFLLDARHLAAISFRLTPNKTRLSVNSCVTSTNFSFFLMLRQKFDSKSGRLDSRRIGEDNTSEARESSVDRNHFYLFRPRDNHLLINIVYLVEFCEMYVSFKGMPNNFSTFLIGFYSLFFNFLLRLDRTGTYSDFFLISGLVLYHMPVCLYMRWRLEM